VFNLDGKTLPFWLWNTYKRLLVENKRSKLLIFLGKIVQINHIRVYFSIFKRPFNNSAKIYTLSLIDTQQQIAGTYLLLYTSQFVVLKLRPLEQNFTYTL